MKHISLWTLSIFFAIQASAQSIPKDGIYLVEKLYENSTQLICKPDQHIVSYHSAFTEEPAEEYSPVRISNERFVPLQLGRSPETRKSKRNCFSVFLQLNTESTKALEVFTRLNLHKNAAILVGGKVIRIVQIDQVVNSGVVQVANCSGAACSEILDYIKTKLNPDKNL